MADNNIGWGQGATNNNIGWGRGSTNDIGWGSVYADSYVGDTDIQGADARFIITIDTTKAGSASDTFVLPWIGTYDVEWGDGTSDVGVTDTQTHVYASSGVYDVAVTATTGRINFNAATDRLKLTEIKNWGATEWTSFDGAFNACSLLLTVSATDAPNLSNVTTLQAIFQNCTILNYIDVSNWDVSNIQTLGYSFRRCLALPSLDVSNWNTSSVLSCYQSFDNCTNLKVDLSGFDINSINQFLDFARGTDINESGTTTNYDNTLISWAAQTPQPNITINFGAAKYSWRAIEARNTLVNTYNWTITDGGIADDAEFVITARTTTSNESFTIPTTGGGYNYSVDWGDGSSDVAQTGNATHVYATAGDYDIQITGTFPRIYFITSTDKTKLIDIKNWGNGAWTSFEQGFNGCTNLTSISAEDIPNFSGLTSLRAMFYGCINITSLNVSNWDVSNVSLINSIFFNCSQLNADVRNWSTSNFTDIRELFYNNDSFDYSLANWDITSVTLTSNFMSFATGLSTANYDATLIGWEANLQATYPSGAGYTATININFGGSQYTLGGAAEIARTSLIVNYGWTITDGGGVNGVLDTYTGAAAAYSLRNLSSSTTDVVRVRRASDNVEQDFSYLEIMDGTLATFCSATDGFVVTWYDQAGSNDATQSTAANQPQIVASGVVITENGMPAVQFDGSNDVLSANRLLSTNEWSIFSASKINNVVGIKSLASQHDGALLLGRSIFINYDSSNIRTFFNNGTSYVGTHSTTATSSQYCITSLATSNDYYLSVNGSLEQVITGQALTPLNTNFTIGALGNASNSLNGNIQEIIVYPSYQGTNRTNIEGNINTYYSIY